MGIDLYLLNFKGISNCFLASLVVCLNNYDCVLNSYCRLSNELLSLETRYTVESCMAAFDVYRMYAKLQSLLTDSTSVTTVMLRAYCRLSHQHLT
jgi:hypothetical protein